MQQRDPEPDLFGAQPDPSQFIGGQADQRGMEDGQDRQILQRVIQHLKQAQEIRHLTALVKTRSSHLKRQPEPGKFLGIALGFSGGRSQQDGHVFPVDGPELTGLFVPNGMLAGP